MGYIIFYRVTDDTVGILRVVRGKRDLPKLMGDS
ncbi:MAG: type II toxin-antitoxin system RelE/ParE family toxin [Cyanothece sp. SIO2G6]|nr:type II toxin-antitoxin system RelE/ParE family toxin [Cyanothece sp. SIO2G6]